MSNINNHNDTENNEIGLLSIISNGRRGEGGKGAGGVAIMTEEVILKKGPWTAAEDVVLIDYVTKHGEGNWNVVQRNTGLARCGKSCRLRWTNHLRPNLKKGAFSPEEEKLILKLHAQYGNKWARMATLLPGRTDNEIKNYWNTRVKRRQRQGLPLYSNDPDQPSTSTAPTTCTTQLTTISTTSNSKYCHQNQYPLSSLHTRTSYSRHTPFLDPTSLSSSSSSSPFFTYHQHTPPLQITALHSKRYRTSPSIIDPPLTTPLTDLEGFNFPTQFNSSLSQIFQTPLESSSSILGVSTPSSIFLTKTELPSNQFSQSNNNPTLSTSTDLLGDILHEAQALVSSQNLKKRSYSSFSEGNDAFYGCQGLDDLPSGLKPKVEPSGLSESMNDLSSLFSGMPPTNQVPDWHNDIATQVSDVQSFGAIMPDDDFILDFKHIASLLPITTLTNPDENPGFYSWDFLPGLC